MAGNPHPFLRSVRGLIGAAILLVPAAASALTITGMKGQGLDSIYGDYAPGGNCKLEPQLTIDDNGLTFHAAGQTVVRKTFEYAVSYMGQDYDGISSAFFPFTTGEYEMGHVLMMMNADEKRGLVTFESNLGPGEKFSPVEAAIVKASPFQLCAGTGSKAAAPVAAPAPAATPPTPLQWDNLAALTARQEYNIDAYDKGAIAAALQSLMGSKMAILKQNMTVTSPLVRQGSLYYLSGNAPHQGGMDQAYILIDAAHKNVQVGLWESGKLTVYAPQSGRIAPPSEIRDMLDRSPPEDAVAAPGTPWEVLPVAGRPPLAYVNAAASPDIKSFTIFCDNGRPTLAMLLNKGFAGDRLTVTWGFTGGAADVLTGRSNREGTFWQAYLTGSNLIDLLLRQSGSAYLRINGKMEGEALLKGSTATLKTALQTCMRF